MFVAYSIQRVEVPTIVAKRHRTTLVLVSTILRVFPIVFSIQVFLLTANVDDGVIVFELETTIMYD